MANYQASETRKIAVTTVDKKEHFGTLCTGVALIADGDCFVAFDENADIGSYLLKANTPVNFPVQFTELHAISSGSANLYILATR